MLNDSPVSVSRFVGSRKKLSKASAYNWVKKILQLLKFFSLAVTPGSNDMSRSFKPHINFQLNATRERSVFRKF